MCTDGNNAFKKSESYTGLKTFLMRTKEIFTTRTQENSCNIGKQRFRIEVTQLEKLDKYLEPMLPHIDANTTYSFLACLLTLKRGRGHLDSRLGLDAEKHNYSDIKFLSQTELISFVI